MSRWYRFMYRLGVRPWEDDTESQLNQLRSLLEQIENGCEAPYGAALDLGCGTGRYSVELAQRGWEVVGLDVVPRAVELARQRSHDAEVTVRFVEGDVTNLERAGVGDGFRLFLDAECFNHLTDDQRRGFARGVDALAGPDAELLLLVWRSARRGPLPPGASRDDLTRTFPGWTIVQECDYDADLPFPLRRIDPRWYLLARM
jgi:SAM-dependent methyltransferase